MIVSVVPGVLWSTPDDLHVIIARMPRGWAFASVGCCVTLDATCQIGMKGSWRVKHEGEILLEGGGE